MRNVLVTGGSRGIGLAIVQRLVGAGYNVIAVARRKSDEFSRAAKAGHLHFHACDLSDIDGIPTFVKELYEKFGAIYGLVNNAGIGTEGLLATMRDSDIEALVRPHSGHPHQICGAPHDGGWRGTHRQYLINHRIDRP
jgi:3-oxoacyl-[acyl-carrier protein] reductase